MDEGKALIPIDPMVCLYPKCGFRVESVAPGPNQNQPPECPRGHGPLVRDPEQDKSE